MLFDHLFDNDYSELNTVPMIGEHGNQKEGSQELRKPNIELSAAGQMVGLQLSWRALSCAVVRPDSA